MRKRELVIIKIGGSVLTDKASNKPLFRKKEAQRIVDEIIKAKTKQDFDLIIVHGAGSFGHPIAKKYRLDKGYLNKNSLKGFALCKQEIFRLNNLFWQVLEGAGLQSSVVQPSAIIRTKDGVISKFDTQFIVDIVAKGIIPILFGDVVIDKTKGFWIVSGDRMVTYLAKKLKADKVIFVSDVDGVFNRNPKVYKDAKLIRTIDRENYKKVIGTMETYNKNDISGEMRGKIIAVSELSGGFEVFLVNGFKYDSVALALKGQNAGTVMRF